MIGLTYLAIALALATFTGLRNRLKYGWLSALFIPLVVAAAATHFVAIFTLGSPDYGVEMLIKLITVALAVTTAAILWTLVPRVMTSPSTIDLERLNAGLAIKVSDHVRRAELLRRREAQVRSSNLNLELRVAERTTQLALTNVRLTESLAQQVSIQRALERSEEEFRISFEASAVGKAQNDPETGRLIRVNRAFAQMLGYEPEDLVGRIACDFTWPEDLAGDAAEYERVKSGQIGAYVREKRFLHRDGSPIWGRVSATVIRFPESGQPSITVSVIENIDERHKAQAALLAAKQHLEDVVRERTAAVVQRDLLLREVYHRVKNNLQIIDGLLVMQARQITTPKAREAVLSLRSRVYALGLVHHQLMGSSDLRTFDVGPFLRELSQHLVEGAGKPGISLAVRAAPLDVGLDFAIPLGLLLTELVTNSLKHAFPAGEGNIEVALERAEDGAVALVVSDNGIGRAAPRARGRVRRSSLGASIINGLVAQLRATLVVENGNGTRSEIRVAAPVLT